MKLGKTGKLFFFEQVCPLSFYQKVKFWSVKFQLFCNAHFLCFVFSLASIFVKKMFKIRFYQKVLYDFRRNMSFDSIKKLGKYFNFNFEKHFSVLTWKKDKIFFVSINRPEKKNCVNHETAKELIDAFKTFEADESADIAILTGQGLFLFSFY